MSESLLLWFISTLFFLVVFCFIGKLRTVFKNYFDTNNIIHIICNISHATYHMQHILCNISYVSYYMHHIICTYVGDGWNIIQIISCSLYKLYVIYHFRVLKTNKEKWSLVKINHLAQTVQWWTFTIKGQEDLLWQPEDVQRSF